MTVRAISFDLFDTLVDLHMNRLPEVEIEGRRFRSTHRDLHAVVSTRRALAFDDFGRTLLQVDRRLREQFYAEGRELPTLARFQALAEQLEIDDPGLPDELTQTHMQRLFEQTEFVPHHPDVLRELAGRATLGVCSNFSHTPTARRVLDQAGLLPHLHAVAISEEVGIRKPRPEIFEALLRELDVHAADVVHVGDNLAADVDGAAELGMRTVWIHRRIPDPEAALREHAGARPTWSIADLSELPALLEGA